MLLDREKIIKICIAAPLGLLVSHLIGYTNVITTSASMILVCSFGAANPRHATAAYSIRRIFTQLVLGLLGGGSVVLLQTYTELPSWVVVLLVVTFVTPILLTLDYRFRYGSGYLLTASIGLLVMSTGMLSKSSYAFQRILLVIIGCTLGFALNCLFSYHSLPRSRRILYELLDQQERLMQALRSGEKGAEEIKEHIGQYKALHTTLLQETRILLQNKRKAPEAETLSAYISFCETQTYFIKALETLCAVERPETLTIAYDTYFNHLEQLVAITARLCREISSAAEPIAMPVLPNRKSDLSEHDMIISGCILVYQHKLQQALKPQ